MAVISFWMAEAADVKRPMNPEMTLAPAADGKSLESFPASEEISVTEAAETAASFVEGALTSASFSVARGPSLKELGAMGSIDTEFI